ncbi:MAG: thioredoxin domain-containing protein [Anaerolineales bacterium]|jgi:thioredoxin 1
MAELVQFSQSTFDSEVLKAAGPVLVDFTASWCHPCHLLEPIVRELADSWTGRVKVGQVDVDANSDLAIRYGVMGVPTLILFIAGQQTERVVGFVPRDKLRAKLEPHLPTPA